MPPIDRYMLEQSAVEDVRLKGADGTLSAQRSAAILAGLRSRSPETSIFDRHLAVEESIAGSPLSVGNKVTLLEDGSATYPAMLAAIAAARKHIHLESYIIEDDDTGQRFADALIIKRRAGVEVRVIYDSFGSKNTAKEFFENLRKNGVEVVEFHPMSPAGILTNINQRDHRKLLIVDGRVAFLGGINISGVYSGDSKSGSQSKSGASGGADRPFEDRPWRDTHLQVEGPVVNDLQAKFMQTWNDQCPNEAKIVASPAYQPKQDLKGPHVVRALGGTGEDAVNPLYVTFLSAISSAESEVFMTIAYFVPDQRLIDALKAAAKRGVDVRIILPSRTDGWVVFHAGRSFYEGLLDSGVKIYERETRLLHSKSAVIDGVWSTVGSSNLDWRSLLHNNELNAVILGPEFGDRMKALFAKDLAASREITLTAWQDRPIQDRLKEAAARTWARML